MFDIYIIEELVCSCSGTEILFSSDEDEAPRARNNLDSSDDSDDEPVSRKPRQADSASDDSDGEKSTKEQSDDAMSGSDDENPKERVFRTDSSLKFFVVFFTIEFLFYLIETLERVINDQQTAMTGIATIPQTRSRRKRKSGIRPILKTKWRKKVIMKMRSF